MLENFSNVVYSFDVFDLDNDYKIALQPFPMALEVISIPLRPGKAYTATTDRRIISSLFYLINLSSSFYIRDD